MKYSKRALSSVCAVVLAAGMLSAPMGASAFEGYSTPTPTEEQYQDQKKNGTIMPDYYDASFGNDKLILHWYCKGHYKFYIYKKMLDLSFKKIGTLNDRDAQRADGSHSYVIVNNDQLKLRYGYPYTFKIAAVHKAGTDKATGKPIYKKVYSRQWRVWMAPEQAEITSAKGGKRLVELNWKRMAHSSGYKVLWREHTDKNVSWDKANRIGIKNYNTTSFAVTGLKPDTKYDFKVVAYYKKKLKYPAKTWHLNKGTLFGKMSKTVTVSTEDWHQVKE